MNEVPASRAGVTADKIAELMADFEQRHAVEDYQAFGWQVWPFVRNLVATDIEWSIYDQHPDRAEASVNTRSRGPLLGRLSFYFGAVWQYLRWLFQLATGAMSSPRAPCDVVFVASGARYQELGGRWVHYGTGPTADLLEAAGMTCAIWQWGPEPQPAARKSIDVIPPIRIRQRLAGLLSLRKAEAAPPWFTDVAAFYQHHVGRELAWPNVRRELDAIARTSALMGRWLDSAKPKLVVSDCWTNWSLVAATLAAHRRGIPVLEIQHGILEWSHYSYHHWVKEPPLGWGALPDMIWMWGERGEALNSQTNRIRQETILGGNPWLSRWLRDDDVATASAKAEAQAMTAGHARTILVTLQGPASIADSWLEEVVGASPADWLWLFRTHPLWKEDGLALVDSLKQRTAATVRGHAPSEIPLYALLGAIDLHVTNSSTCANEALAFGRPTILMDRNGLAIFRREVEAGVISYAAASEFYDAAQRAFSLDRLRLKAAAEPLYVTDAEKIRQATNRLTDLVARKREPIP